MNNSYTCLQTAIWKNFVALSQENQSPQNVCTITKTFLRPILPWAFTIKHVRLQSIQSTAVIMLSNIFCSKHLQALSSPFLCYLWAIWSVLPSSWQLIFHPLLCTCFFTQLLSSTFAEASCMVTLYFFQKGPVAKAAPVNPSLKLCFMFTKSLSSQDVVSKGLLSEVCKHSSAPPNTHAPLNMKL